MCGHTPYSVTSSWNGVIAVIRQSSANGGIGGKVLPFSATNSRPSMMCASPMRFVMT
jgi:hypothetical protein